MSVQKDTSKTEAVAAPLSEDQIRSQVEGEFAAKFELLQQQIALLTKSVVKEDEKPAAPRNNYNFGVDPFEKPEDKGDTLVHFVEDGFTVGSVVYYRGQEALLPKEQAEFNTREQVLAYGRVMYNLGPWDGDEYDVDDPKLNERERAALVRANEARRQARLRLPL